MKIKNNNKIIIKSFSLLFIFCMVFMGCNDDDVDKIGQTSISFAEDSLSVADDVGTVYLQLELTEPLEEPCRIYLKSSIEKSIRFDFPEYIVLGKRAVRGKYPIYIYDSKYSSPDEYVTFTLDQVSDALVIDKANSSIGLTIKGKDNAGKVFIQFAELEYSAGEDKDYFELPFKIIGVLESSVMLRVKATNGTAIEGVDFEMETEIKLSKGETWNFIPIEIEDNPEDKEDRAFTVSLVEIVSVDTLVEIYHDMSECNVVIRNVERQLQITDSIVEKDETTGEFDYKFNLTAQVSEKVTAKVIVDESSTAIEGVHFKLRQDNIEFLPGDTEAEIKIEIIDDKLGNKDRTIFLKLQDVTGGVVISEDYGHGKIIIKNDDNSIGFANKSQIMISESTLRIPIVIEGLLDERLTVLLKVISGTAEENIDFVTKTRVIEKGEDSTYIEISSGILDVYKKDFKLELIGLQGESITINSTIDTNRNSCTVDINRFIDKTKWKVLNPEAPFNNKPELCFDNNDRTFWACEQAGVVAPWDIILDMQFELDIKTLHLVGRHSYRNDTQLVEFYIANASLAADDTGWQKIATWDNKDGVQEDLIGGEGVSRAKIDVDGNPTGRYLMIRVLKGRDGGNTIGAFSEITINQ